MLVLAEMNLDEKMEENDTLSRVLIQDNNLLIIYVQNFFGEYLLTPLNVTLDFAQHA